MMLAAILATTAAAKADLPPASLSPLPALANHAATGGYGISGDGHVPVGSGTTSSLGSPSAGIRWVNGAPQQLWFANYDNVAFNASFDGTIVVGTYASQNGAAQVPVKFQNGVVTELTTPSMGAYALGCSASGDVIVGGGAANAFRWTPSGPVSFSGLPGHNHSFAYGVSADGQTAVGESDSNLNAMHPIVWPSGRTSNPVALPYPTGFNTTARALDVSADGNTIVGSASDQEIQHACVWVNGAVTDLGGLPVTTGVPMSQATGVSADGSVIVGNTGHSDDTQWNIANPHAFIWTPTRGMIDLKTYLGYYGLDSTGWTFDQITAVSDDGMTFVGSGHYPDGNSGGWIATVPGPSAAAIFFIAAAALGPRRRPAAS
jgi:probable HAF family extracellular repeat protein